MKRRSFVVGSILFLCTIIAGCASQGMNTITIDPGSVLPGTRVMRAGTPIDLIGTPIAVGDQLPATALVEAGTMDTVDLSQSRGRVLFLSIVPSIDTKVCEAQTHYLGEQGDRLPAGVERITISRDTPFAQSRFAAEAKLTDIRFLSDYKEGAFGRSLGLLMDGPRLLARAVILVDKEGVVRYIQVVPEITNLPDMEKAFDQAIELLQ
jgi:thiol peroxidase